MTAPPVIAGLPSAQAALAAAPPASEELPVVPPVGPRVVSTLSPSRASDFLSCPLRYRLRVVDRLSEPPSPIAARGTLVHGALEQVFDLPAPERTVTAAVALLRPVWAQLVAERPELAAVLAQAEPAAVLPSPAAAGGAGSAGAWSQPQPPLPQQRPGIDAVGPEPGGSEANGAEQQWFEAAARLVEAYYTLEDPTRLEPAGRELRLEVPLEEGPRLTGHLDRLDQAADGSLRIVDYKTGRTPSENFEQQALSQMKFYALLVWRTRGVVPRMLRLVYLKQATCLEYQVDEADLLAFERRLRALWSTIATALESGDFRARPGPLCASCSFQQHCPEFGGSPPPYPGALTTDPGASARASSQAGPTAQL